MSTLRWPNKDPDEVLDYELNWEARLAGDTINTSIWFVTPVNITMETDSHDSAHSFLWLSEGELGKTYKFTNRITTVGGRTMDQSVKLRIREK